MSVPRNKKPIDSWNGNHVAPGEQRSLTLGVSESYSGMTVEIPIHIRRAVAEGPAVFVVAALHGDEINGTGAIRQLVQDEDLVLMRGSLVLVPVVNMLAFERHSRYLPDRRDLNRSFPGKISGSLASRMAHSIFEEIVMRCDYGIDLHTAAIRRTNYATVRGIMDNPQVSRIAKAFGSEIIVNRQGPARSLRREACKAGCPTILMEGGEVWKVEPTIVEATVRGVKNVLRELEMLDGELEIPDQQMVIGTTKWIRAEEGGFLQFHVKPGDVVEKEQPLATNTNLLGEEGSVLLAPFNGVIIGMTTLPAVSPGEPVCHIGRLPRGTQPSKVRRVRSEEEGLEERLVESLASNILVVDPPKD